MNAEQETQIPEDEKLHRSTYDPRAGHTLPTHGDYARTLTIASTQGVLSTIDREDGTPYGSIVELLPLDDGDFVFFVSNMASHTKNLKKDPRCSLLVADGFGRGYALSLSRATFLGGAARAEDPSQYRDDYLKLHPEASVYIDFPDFHFYKLHVERVRYIGGFGRMSWLDEEEYHKAAPDPLWKSADGIIKHMNDDHGDNLHDYALAFGGIEGDIDEIEMNLVDRFGFEMRVKQGDKGHTVRLSFSEEVSNAKQVRQELVAMAKKARETLGDAAKTQEKAHH